MVSINSSAVVEAEVVLNYLGFVLLLQHGTVEMALSIRGTANIISILA